jgi:hypothetical protein
MPSCGILHAHPRSNSVTPHRLWSALAHSGGCSALTKRLGHEMTAEAVIPPHVERSGSEASAMGAATQ